MDEILKAAKNLYDLDWGVHWLRPNSKAPVKKDWSAPKRDSWEVLEREYRPGYGLGVRLGGASKLKDGFLANIDVDIKSKDLRHRKEAIAFVKSHFKDLDKAPTIITGYGLRFVVKTKVPLVSQRLTTSPDRVLVQMPQTARGEKKPSPEQQKAVANGRMTQAQYDAGWRLRPAWEVEFMSAGKQVVLPPSIHPDTKRPYVWGHHLNGGALPLVEGFDHQDLASVPLGQTVLAADETGAPLKVDLNVNLKKRLWPGLVELIVSGNGVDDRSAVLADITRRLCTAGLSDDEILSVLTDKAYYMGQTALDRRPTRQAAAAWIKKYYLAAARAETKDLFTVVADLGRQLELSRTEKGSVRPTLQNTVNILRYIDPKIFCLDNFAMREFYGCDTPWGGKADKALTDGDVAKIRHWLGEAYGFEPSRDVVYDAITVVTATNSFNPVQRELEALPKWDGTERLGSWLKVHFGAVGPDCYLSQVFRKWLVASITRTYKPGTKFDWMPLLEGGQGTGKSSFGAILFGQKYFTDWLPVLSDKDAALGLLGIRCVEFGELDQLRRSELETAKAFITRQIDKVRPPYGRKSEEMYRRCVFFGTTNRHEYLKDDSGNRRFIPIEVGELDFKALRRDRDQLWAEALVIYHSGLEENLYLTGEALEFAKSMQSEKVVTDETVFMVEAFKKFVRKELKKPEKERFNFQKFKLVTLFNAQGPFAKWPENGRSHQFAWRALRAVGAERRKAGGISVWRYALKGVGPPPKKTDPA